MSETRRIYAQSVIHFRKSHIFFVGAIVTTLSALAATYVAGRGLSFGVVAALPLVYAFIDLLWSRAYPMLSIGPGRIVYRSQFWRRAVEVPRSAIASWRRDGKHLVIECDRARPVKVNLEHLPKKDRELVLVVLRERGYGNLET